MQKQKILLKREFKQENSWKDLSEFYIEEEQQNGKKSI